ncbi:hypothetical protein [Planctellipticum variicoloris]|uniref:hypothetical protein n=1 Tax=Planctellipticum variicoloris TaxID=3064265 RepID=UPI003013E473|nr:hypothetical protein SH412_002139 [Planctomycetaceae bacterium SH412]
MDQPPSKDEILAAFRAVLDKFDGDVEVKCGQPNPNELANEGAYMQFVGRLKGWMVFAKKNAIGIVLGICLYGDFWQGIDTIRSHTKIAYDEIASCLEYAHAHRDQSLAFAISERPSEWPLSSDEPIRLVTTTTTTTQPPLTTPPLAGYVDIPPGSGFVPSSSGWQGYA